MTPERAIVGTRVRVLEHHRIETRREDSFLPSFDYLLDESDPDVTVLRRQDGTFVAAFSARGATKEGIVEAAEHDYEAPLRANADLMSGLWTEEQPQSA